MKAKPVQQVQVRVGASASLNLRQIGRTVGSAPPKTINEGLYGGAKNIRWEVPVDKLPESLQAQVRANPLLCNRDVVHVDYPLGKTGISSIGFMNYVCGGKLPPEMQAFLKPGRKVVNAERSWVVSQFGRAGFADIARHVAQGGDVFDFVSSCQASSDDCAKAVGHDTPKQAPMDHPAQRGVATQSMLTARSFGKLD